MEQGSVTQVEAEQLFRDGTDRFYYAVTDIEQTWI